VDPPTDNASQCYQYTNSDEDDNRPAPTTDDRVAGKRPMATGSSRAGASPAETAPGPLTGQGSASRSQAPKHRRLLRVVDNDDEEETAPTLVRKPHTRPDVALAEGGRTAGDPPAAHAPAEQACPEKAEAAVAAGHARWRFFMASHRSSNL
jgi:hypothetical protein